MQFCVTDPSTEAHTMLADTIAAYTAARSASEPLRGGSAPYTSSHFFKIEKADYKPFARSWDHYFSSEGSSRSKSALKAASRISEPGSIISLGTARPHAQYYPWQSIRMNVTDVRCLSFNGEIPNTEAVCEKGEVEYDLGVVLNYGYAGGSPQLLRFVTEHVEMIHRPAYRDWDCALTCGTTSAIDIVLRMLCNHGDSVLCEDFTYPGTIEAARCLGLKMVGLKMDEDGLLPVDLELKLRNWGADLDGPRPKLLYTIPTGQNPTGTTQSKERRREVYQLAEKYDLLILEDDPYHFIQLRASNTVNELTNHKQPHSDINGSPNHENNTLKTSLPSPSDHYTVTLPPSFLSLDTSGRVLRLDSTSKILAPGLRVGWITGCSQLIQRFLHHTEQSTLAPSGPSQALLYKLLDQTWGHAGFLAWLEYLSAAYRRRLEVLVRACERFLPEGLCTWTTPEAGMFLWVKLDWARHPMVDCEEGRHRDRDRRRLVLLVEDRVYLAARKRGVLVSKGSWFAVGSRRQEVFLRLTFAAVGEEELEVAVERFGRAVSEEYQMDWEGGV